MMRDVAGDQLTAAVEEMHACTARLAYVESVQETFGDGKVWEGVVHVFDLEGTRLLRAPTPGHRQSRAATSAGSTLCCTFRP
jgi:hypothetical protein